MSDKNKGLVALALGAVVVGVAFLMGSKKTTPGPPPPPPGQANVYGFITDATSHQALSGAVITMGGIHTATSVADGSYSITNLAPGVYPTDVALSGYHSAIFNATVIEGNNQINIQLDKIVMPAYLEGHITDATTGLAIGGAIAQANGVSATARPSDGFYHLALAAGTYQVTYSHAFYTSQIRTVTLAEGEHQTLDVALSPVPAGEGIRFTINLINLDKVQQTYPGYPPPIKTDVTYLVAEQYGGQWGKGVTVPWPEDTAVFTDVAPDLGGQPPVTSILRVDIYYQNVFYATYPFPFSRVSSNWWPENGATYEWDVADGNQYIPRRIA